MNVNLARRNDFATVAQAHERAVTEGPELTVVIPTLNERDNIGPLVELLDAVLDTVSWEVIFVDDNSPDGTAEQIREISRGDRQVRCLQRLGRRGLTTACIEGALATSAPYIAVMDADMQHDEKLLPQMLAILKSEPVDLVVGSRHVAGGGIGGWDAGRAKMSAAAARLSRIICKAEIADPISGFFMLRREVLDGALRRLSGQGFKILLDIVASSQRPLRLRELPYEFRERQHGESKLDTRIAWEYMMLIADKLIGHIVPVRFALFALVGGIGLVYPYGGPLVCAHHRRRGLRSGAGLCCGCSDDIEFLPKQSLHLPGPTPARCRVAAGPVHLLCDLRPRYGRQCRHRRLCLFQERGLVARRPGRRRRRIGLELCRLVGFHLEAKIT